MKRSRGNALGIHISIAAILATLILGVSAGGFESEKKAGACRCAATNPKDRRCLSAVRRVAASVNPISGVKTTGESNG
jgi:hypothetical protein